MHNIPASAVPLPTEGVVGHLTPTQKTALSNFWKELFALLDAAPVEGTGPKPKEKEKEHVPKDDAAKEAYRAEQERKDAQAAFTEFGSQKFMTSFWELVAMDDPDAIVLKFLRARKWNVSAGVAMLASCIKWRISYQVNRVVAKGEEGMQDVDGFIAQLEMGKSYSQGTDYFGRPIIYLNIAKHHAKDQPQKSLEDFIVNQMENIRCLFAPPVDKVIMVFNMEGFGMNNMDMKCLMFIVKCLEAYYPESLHKILVHSAPWVFNQIWKVVAPMLDPVVRAKVEMTKTPEDLIAHIPKQHLIKSLGGFSEWEWNYIPVMRGENVMQSDTKGTKIQLDARCANIANFETLTREWILSPNSEVADTKREILKHEMRAQYFLLDPYIRGRGAYHRLGNVIGNGLVSFSHPYRSTDGSVAEWETRGQKYSMEGCLIEAARLRRKLELEIKE